MMFVTPTCITELFFLGMDRELPMFYKSNDMFPSLNIGAGNKIIRDSIPLDLPGWDADRDPIPFKDENIGTIYAFHFLEHVVDPIRMLLEFQRVLIVGGVVNIVVPYYSANIAH